MNGAPPRVTTARLIVVTDTTVAPVSGLVGRVERLLALASPRSVTVQLRDELLPVRVRLALGAQLSGVCRAHEQGFVVNDRLDLALLLAADGVHLGEDAVAVEDARALLPPGAWVSCALHAVADLAECTADAALLSPVAAPRKGRRAIGLAALSAARAVISNRSARSEPRGRELRLYALGGIDASNAAECLASGADGVAVVGAALDGRDPTPLLAALGIVR